jgi:glycosyltransferase involved in cell wall biosynthesis
VRTIPGVEIAQRIIGQAPGLNSPTEILQRILLMPFLTIAIPTFNRIRWLSLTLPAIIEQVKEFPVADIEVLVSNNCSTDDTWAFLQETAKQVPFIRLNHNETNIGSEAHFYLLPKLATGRYLYMIGDDDLFEPGALRRILEALQDGPDYLVINFDVYDALLEKCLRRNNLKAFADEAFANQDACMARIDAMAMSFISIWVGRREFFNIISEEKYRYFSNWGMSIQADRYFGISRFPKGKLIATSCLRARQTTELNHQEFFLWFLHGSVEVFRYAEESGVLSKANIRSIKSLLLRRVALKRIRWERRNGIFKRGETYGLLRADYGELLTFWLLGVPTMFTPGLGKLISVARWLLGRAEP